MLLMGFGFQLDVRGPGLCVHWLLLKCSYNHSVLFLGESVVQSTPGWLFSEATPIATGSGIRLALPLGLFPMPVSSMKRPPGHQFPEAGLALVSHALKPHWNDTGLSSPQSSP